MLVPQCVEAVAGHKNFFGTDVLIVGAGGIYDGRGVASVLTLGAAGAWVGTAFLCAAECNIEPGYQQRIIDATSADTVVQRYYRFGDTQPFCNLAILSSITHHVEDIIQTDLPFL